MRIATGSLPRQLHLIHRVLVVKHLKGVEAGYEAGLFKGNPVVANGKGGAAVVPVAVRFLIEQYILVLLILNVNENPR